MDGDLSPELERARDGWAEALEGHPLVTADDLINEVLSGEAQFWRSDNADVFTRVAWPILEMGPVAGDMSEMLEVLLPKIERWAAAAGCTEIFIQAGRKGWSRVLASRGYSEAAIILRKPLRWD